VRSCSARWCSRSAALIRLRNSHPAFGGEFELLDGDDSQLSLQWQAGPHRARLDVDLARSCGTVRCEGPDGPQLFRLDGT
jgi:sucrose phosphorylase